MPQLTNLNTLAECEAECENKNNIFTEKKYETWTNSLKGSAPPSNAQMPKFSTPTEIPLTGFFNGYIAYEWTGSILIETPGSYTFYTKSDDGSYLDIDDTQVVDNGGNHGRRERSGTIELSSGIHSFRIYYFNSSLGGYFETPQYHLDGNVA